MPATYEPIASQTLGSTASSVEFTSIPGTYTDLLIVCSATMNQAGFAHQVRFNTDNGANYSTTILFGTGSTAGSYRESSKTSILASYYGTPGTSSPDATVIHVMSYANTNVNKTVLAAAASLDGVDRVVGLWRSTSAITSVALIPFNSRTYSTGSTFSLYGIKAA